MIPEFSNAFAVFGRAPLHEKGGIEAVGKLVGGFSIGSFSRPSSQGNTRLSLHRVFVNEVRNDAGKAPPYGSSGAKSAMRRDSAS